MKTMPNNFARPLARSAIVVALFAVTACQKSGGGTVDNTEYTLKDCYPRAGIPVRLIERMDMQMDSDTQKANAVPLKKTNTLKKDREWKETILVAGKREGEFDRLQLEYIKNQENTDGQSAGSSLFVGKTILIERKDNGYRFSAERGQISPEERRELERLYHGTGPRDKEWFADFLPGKPVRVGDSWELQADRLAGSLGGSANIPFDKEKSKATAKLARVYAKNGHQYGVVEVTAKFPLKVGGPLGVKEGTALNIAITMDANVDGGAYEFKATAKIHGTINLEPPQQKVMIEVNATLEMSATELKPN